MIRTPRLRALLLLMAPFFSFFSAKAGNQSAEKFEETLEIKATYNYLLALPHGYEEGGDWPLVLFLHGIGERGTDVNKVAAHGPPKLIASGKQFPFVLASPQCPDGEFWEPDKVHALTQHLIKKLNIDPDRVHLTGLSMGGYGTWLTAGKFHQTYASIAPVCGGGWGIDAFRMKNVPVWAFHGEKDVAVPVVQSKIMVDALIAKGSNPSPKLTIYPEIGHNCWDLAYADEQLYTWMMAQRLSLRAQEPLPATPAPADPAANPNPNPNASPTPSAK